VPNKKPRLAGLFALQGVKTPVSPARSPILLRFDGPALDNSRCRGALAHDRARITCRPARAQYVRTNRRPPDAAGTGCAL